MKRRRAFVGHGLAAVLACTPVAAVQAYNLSSHPWPSPETGFYVYLPGGGASWNTAFKDAMATWSDGTAFNFFVAGNDYRNPCTSPSSAGSARNGVDMTATQCGDAWGSGVLAITAIYLQGGVRVQAGVVFNSSYSWSVYAGPWRSFSADLRRVAVHELGHALGLNHEEVLPAIMDSFVGPIETPTTDDLAGVQALYGPPPDTWPNPFSFIDQDDVPVSTVITSAPVTITGITGPAAINISGGTYSIGCGAAFTGAPGTIANFQSVCVRHNSAPTSGTPVNTVLNVGGLADVFTSWTSPPGPDADGDGVGDASDNCTLVSNPAQCDSDGDGYGNACDGDLNNNTVTNSQDFVLLRAQLARPSVAPDYNEADLNCNGAVNSQDVVIFRNLLGEPSGPSGVVP